MRALVMLAALALAAPAAWGGEPDPIKGARFYADNCGRCHNYRSSVEHGDREWSIVMAHMRVVAGIPGDHARDIEAFLRRGNNPARRSLPPVGARPPGISEELPAADAEALVRTNGCVGCHVIRGVGGALGPNLDTVFHRKDERWVRAQITDPRQNNPETVMPQFGLSAAEVDAIVAYLRGTSEGGAAP